MNLKYIIDCIKKENIRYIENCRLSQYTTIRIGGAAKLAVFPKNINEALLVLKEIRNGEYRSIVLGNGSNVLVSDSGFDGVAVILSNMREMSVEGDLIRADAGVPLTRLAVTAAENTLTGLEFAYGIPGSVGGGVFMNAGAYGGEIGNVVESSVWYDKNTGKTGAYSGDEHRFSYRHSVYTDEEKTVLSVVFRLEKGNHSMIVSQMNDYMNRRREKQPLEFPSAGSVFKRGNGFITAKLIEEAGLKGRRIGGAQVSEKHAGFIVNLGDATADDVRMLIEIVKQEVYEKFGCEIECEVRYIGNAD